jgi:hypothetical protein
MMDPAPLEGDWEVPQEHLEALGAFAADFAAPGFEPVRRRTPQDPKGGVWVYHETMVRFLQAADRLTLWRRPFKVMDWMKTEEWRRLVHEHGAIEAADGASLIRFLTSIFTHDRFNDGILGNAVMSGHVPRIIARFAELAEQGRRG